MVAFESDTIQAIISVGLTAVLMFFAGIYLFDMSVEMAGQLGVGVLIVGAIVWYFFSGQSSGSVNGQ